MKARLALVYGLGETPSTYYTTFESTPASDWLAYTFDDEGIPRVDYGGEIGLQYNPTTIAQYALALFNDYLSTGNSQDTFMLMVNWLKANYTPVGEVGAAYRYSFPLSAYNLAPGWISSVSQGNVLSVLWRAYLLTSDPDWITLAKKVLFVLLAPVELGGTLRLTPEGNIWLEEAPSRAQGNYSLDDFIFAIIGIHDYLQMAPSDMATLQDYLDCLRSLDRSIGFYDDDGGLIHDRRFRQKWGPGMLNILSKEMKHLYQLTGDDFYLSLSNKWKAYAVSVT